MTGEARPRMVILAGPNGAGKTTFSSTLLEGEAGRLLFLNADIEALRLSPSDYSAGAVPAARNVLEQLDENLRKRQSFAIETTLSGRARLRHVRFAVADGWAVDLYFLWLRTVDLAQARVAARVSVGGHDIPRDVVTRRYFRGLNLLPVYCREVSRWIILDNSGRELKRIASGSNTQIIVDQKELFSEITSYSKGAWQ